jgi:UDP-N-acetylglucosamine transferase subunit ALG13
LIFVSVGTQRKFDRLIEYSSKAQEDCEGFHPVFVQCLGGQRFGLNGVDMLSKDEFTKAILNCKVFVSHLGVGNLLLARRLGKKAIFVPRESRYEEHRNDHQLDTADALYNLVGLKTARTYQDFKKCFLALKFVESPSESDMTGALPVFIDSYLRHLSQQQSE